MKIFVSDLKDGDFITDQIFSLEEIQQHKTRSQQPYYRLILQDRTGEIAAKIWQDDFENCHLRDVSSGDVVKIDGQVSTYNKQQQLTIKKLTKTDDYDITELVQSSEKDLDKMYSEIAMQAKSIKNKHLKQLFDNLFTDKKFISQYKRSPAAEKVHHDFIGGLMEHTLEMFAIAEAILPFYPEADRDLVMSGVILHDIGKLQEFTIRKTAIVRTVKGKLVGHIIQGIELVHSKLPKDFPDSLWMKLEHIIVSHQGELEFGSPIKPATIEAEIVHTADYASSHIRQFQKAIRLGEGFEPGFSNYQKWIGTQVYLD